MASLLHGYIRKRLKPTFFWIFSIRFFSGVGRNINFFFKSLVLVLELIMHTALNTNVNYITLLSEFYFIVQIYFKMYIDVIVNTIALMIDIPGNPYKMFGIPELHKKNYKAVPYALYSKKTCTRMCSFLDSLLLSVLLTL